MVERLAAAAPTTCGSQRREAAHADAAFPIFDAIERFVEQSLIGSELLQSAHSGARADYRDEVVGAHIVIEELADGVTHRWNVFARQSEAVHNKRQRAVHLRGLKHRRGRRHIALCELGRRGPLSTTCRLRRDVGEIRDRLRFAVLQEFEIGGLKIGDAPALGIVTTASTCTGLTSARIAV